MTVLRELVARLGFEVDRGGFAAAQKGVAGIQTALRGTAQQAEAANKAQKATQGAASSASGMLSSLAQAAASVGITSMLKGMVEMASSAQETSSLLDQVFGVSGAKELRAWSTTMGDTIGRSGFALQKYAGQLGSVIDPMLGNKQRAKEMSQSFSALAVDLTSFFDSNDEEALRSLRSGLTGEYESLKKYGVILNDASLQEMAHAQGINKKITAMSVAEKTELRYAAIMKQTKNAQGDAARTANGFANSSRNLKDSLSALGTMMGQAVLPYLEKALIVARDATKRFKELAEGTFILKAAMLVLSAVASALALRMVAAFIVPAVAVLALIWAVDQLHAAFSGGRSDIADWLDAWAGAGTAAKAIDTIRYAMDLLVESLKAMGGQLAAKNKIAELAEGTPLGDWAAESAAEQRALSRPNRDSQGRNTRRYGQVSPRVRADPAHRVDAQFGGMTASDSDGEWRTREERAEWGLHRTGFASVLDAQRAEFVREDRAKWVLNRGGLASVLEAQRAELAASGVVERPTMSRAIPAPAGGMTPAVAQTVVVNQGPTNIAIHGQDPAQAKRMIEDLMGARDRAAMAAVPSPWGQ